MGSRGFDELYKILPDKVEQISVITGAGISQESGVPVFRGKDGLWKNYRPEELATLMAFTKNPVLVWEWYEMRRQIIKKSNPNPAHYILVEMEEFFENFLLITQNVDGLHEKAGSKNILEIHGNIWRARCMQCNYKNFLDTPLSKIPPECLMCGSIMRPDVLWFGENYDLNVLQKAQDFLKKTNLLLVIGSSGQVSIPVYLAKESQYFGAFVIEINIEFSEFSHFSDYIVREKAAIALPEIWKVIKFKYSGK